MRHPFKILLTGVCVLAVLVPLSAWGQSVGEVERMVQGKAKTVASTNNAEIRRAVGPRISPVQVGADLEVHDVLGLQDQIWMELIIDRVDLGLSGHAILAEAGAYRIDSLRPDNTLLFRLRQGRMSVNLKRGAFGVFLKDRLLSILGTEVFIQADTTLNEYRVYLKEGHIQFSEAARDNNPAFFLDVQGKDRAWRWRGDQLPQELSGDAFRRWKRQMKYDARTVWRKPLFKRTWVRAGLATLAGAAVYCALQCDGSNIPTALGDIIIDIPD